jgi:hypothetical protein
MNRSVVINIITNNIYYYYYYYVSIINLYFLPVNGELSENCKKVGEAISSRTHC